MENTFIHSFHIPVMGLGFTIDTPVKIAHYGISSVVSIMEDGLVEEMRKHYCTLYQLPYAPISEKREDHRAKRITAYLNLVNELVEQKTRSLKLTLFEPGTEITKYFELLPDDSDLKLLYKEMLFTTDQSKKEDLQKQLRSFVRAGSIDVNIMSKVNKTNYSKDGSPLPMEYSDALSALRGYAKSDLNSSVIFSAGYNPALYSHIEQFDDFFPNEDGFIKKKIVLKVSDYRSAVTQGKLLAKKGLWTSEFRIESGLNCGGHAFATEGLLLGPILEEFKSNRDGLEKELFDMCNTALTDKNKNVFKTQQHLRVTVQGGIGTSDENSFLLNYYRANSTGWGSPFLLVPEATNVEPETLLKLANARPGDYYLSNASPLGIPINNFRNSSSEKQREFRISIGKPGSPCFRKFLSTNTEFTKKPICIASRQYQHLKIKQLQETDKGNSEYDIKLKEITDKECLCMGLSSSVLLNNNIEPKHNLTAAAICPGPNLAYFSGIFSLQQMTDHIYGRTNLLNAVKRSNMFINELVIYVDYLKKEIEKNLHSINNNKIRSLKTFQSNLLEGVEYYRRLKSSFIHEVACLKDEMYDELNKWEDAIKGLMIPSVVTPTLN